MSKTLTREEIQKFMLEFQDEPLPKLKRLVKKMDVAEASRQELLHTILAYKKYKKGEPKTQSKPARLSRGQCANIVRELMNHEPDAALRLLELQNLPDADREKVLKLYVREYVKFSKKNHLPVSPLIKNYLR